MVIQRTLKLANWAEIKIYVRRNLRFRSVSDISRVKKKKKKNETKQNKKTLSTRSVHMTARTEHKNICC